MASLLIADDHAPTRELLTERLGQEGYEVQGAADADTAFEHFAHARPDLVLVSLALPTGDAPHLARRIRDTEAGAPVPVVVYDAAHLGKARGIQAILELKANAYLPDPTVHAELRDRIQRLIHAQASARPAAGTPPRAGRPPSVPPGTAPANEEVAASGELAAGVLADVLVDAWHMRFSGVLTLEDGDAHRALHLLDGVPTALRSSVRAESLGRFLQDRGDLDEAGYRATLEVMAEGGVSEAGALVATGAIEAGDALYAALADHAAAGIRRAFSLRRGRYRLVPGRRRAQEAPALEIGGLSLVLAGARQAYPVAFFQKALEPRMDAFPYRLAAFGEHLGELGLEPGELAFAMKITGEATTRDLVTGAGAKMKDALCVLWYLARVEVVRFAEAAHQSEDRRVYRTAEAARKKKPLPPELDAELREAALKVLTSSYFGALDLDIAATVDDVERAYHEKVLFLHADAHDAYDVSPIEDLLQTVVDRLNAAYRVLSVAEKRKAYLSYLLSRQSLASRHGPVEVDAEIALRRGTKLMATRDYAGAELAFREAVSLNPREPQYYCHLAFAQFKNGHGPAEVRAKEPRKLLRKALTQAPDLEVAQVLLGILEQEVGDRPAARKHFLRVLKQNPESQTARAALQRLDRVD